MLAKYNDFKINEKLEFEILDFDTWSAKDYYLHVSPFINYLKKRENTFSKETFEAFQNFLNSISKDNINSFKGKREKFDLIEALETLEENITQTQIDWIELSINNGMKVEEIKDSMEKILKRAPRNQTAKNILDYLNKDKK